MSRQLRSAQSRPGSYFFSMVILALALLAAALAPCPVLAGQPQVLGTPEGTPDVNPPFGSFDAPANNATVRSSIPVTGWVLDDTEGVGVKIYCSNSNQPNNRVYVGDAVFVEGARPDVEAQNPHNPWRNQAGWGYMMLTNFLPCSDPNAMPGNYDGVYTLYAEGYDKAGNTVDLGSKTITVANANAIKPFGAIDTPAQGETISGNSYRNQGWALTPLPNALSPCGGGIGVVMDGKYVGSPVYSQSRPDISQFFPGYANSDAPGGYFELDTTAYQDGVHTIQWTATDTGNNTDGIGSRYFTIDNSAGGSGYQTRALTTVDPGPAGVDMTRTIDHEWPLTGNQAWQLDLATFFPEAEAGVTYTYAAYTKVLDTLRLAPVGSTLDTSRGMFYWLAGPAFMGDHDLIFTRRAPGGSVDQINVRINFPQPDSQ